MRLWSLLLCGSLLAASLAGPLQATAQLATPIAESYGGTPSTAILVSATNDPLAVLASDGTRHLQYDLLVTNAFLAPVTLQSIDVFSPAGDRLLRLEGEDLLIATQPLLGGTPQAEIPVSGTVAVVMNVITDPGQDIDRLMHTISYDLPPDAPDQALIGSREVIGPELTVSTQEAVVIAPPLTGEGWMALNGCCAAASVHRFERVPANGAVVAKAEMFAIDWMRLEDGQLSSGDGSRSEDFFGYGAEVRSVADGTVVYARDGMPDQTPDGEVTGIERPEDFGGNQVMVEIAPDVYAWYAHLEPGSVAVAVGDEVTTGQPIGRLGNTGHSTAPHLHFGLFASPNSVTGRGVPMVIDEYELAGTIDPIYLTDPPPDLRFPIDTSSQGAQSETLPLFMTVVDFP